MHARQNMPAVRPLKIRLRHSAFWWLLSKNWASAQGTDAGSAKLGRGTGGAGVDSRRNRSVARRACVWRGSTATRSMATTPASRTPSATTNRRTALELEREELGPVVHEEQGEGRRRGEPHLRQRTEPLERQFEAIGEEADDREARDDEAEQRQRLLAPGRAEAVGAEKDPTERDEEERHIPLPEGRERAVPRGQRAMEHEQPTVPCAPGGEGPVGAVPETAEHHRHHDVDALARLRAPVAAERDVQVVAQPERQRHVPAAPEVARRDGLVGTVEVLWQLDAEQPPEPDRHVGIAAEVEVDLEGVPEERQPGARHVERQRRNQQRIDEIAEPVGDQRFFCEPDAKEKNPRLPARRDPGLGDTRELRDELVVAGERTGDEVREEGDEPGKADEVALGRRLTAPDVDDVGERLEGVEADPRRQHDLEPARRVRRLLEPEGHEHLLRRAHEEP